MMKILTLIYLSTVEDSFQWRVVNDHLEPSHYGRLEIRKNQEPWGSVCVNSITVYKVRSICTYLGYISAHKHIYAWTKKTNSSSPIIWDDVEFPSRSRSNSWQSVTCTHMRVLYIACDSGKT